jgi:hypothetical protein
VPSFATSRVVGIANKHSISVPIRVHTVSQVVVVENVTAIGTSVAPSLLGVPRLRALIRKAARQAVKRNHRRELADRSKRVLLL